jgi:cellulose synthase/poly-beta-1,6-N-acetylglucosamine synthase-like glycosyltransferase
MQQLRLNSENAPAREPIIAKPVLTIVSRLVGLVMLLSPILMLGLVFLYSFTIIDQPIWQSTLALYVILLLIYQFLIGFSRLTQIAFSMLATRRATLSRRLGGLRVADSPKIQPVSILLWAHNQSYGLIETIKSLLALNYPDYEIIVVNDGSTDDSLAILNGEFGLQPLNRVYRRLLQTGPITAVYTSPKYPILTIIDKPFSGRAESLNVSLNFAKAPLACILDPDQVLARDALLLLAKPFIEQPANTLMSVAMSETQADIEEQFTFNDNLLLIERKRLFHSSLIERNTFCLVSATNNALRLCSKAKLIELGGFREDTSDLQICLQLQRGGNAQSRVAFIPDTICWGQYLSSQAISQNYLRWQAATLKAVAANVGMLFQFRLKWKCLAYLLLVLEVVAPMLDLLSMAVVPLAFILGAIPLELMLLFFLTMIVFALLESLGGLIADEFSQRCRHSLAEIISLVLASLVESTTNRPMANFWRLLGEVSSLASSAK